MITTKQILLLTLAVREVDSWRGSLTGNYGDSQSIQEEAERLEAHDTYIAECKKALRELRLMVRQSSASKPRRKVSKPS